MARVANFAMFRNIVLAVLQPTPTDLTCDVAVAVRFQVSAEVISVVLSFEHRATFGASRWNYVLRNFPLSACLPGR